MSAQEDRRMIDGAKAVYRDLKSVETAITRRCIECTYDPQATGSVMEQIARCEARTCPLYDFRPKSEGQAARQIEVNTRDSAEIRYKDRLLARPSSNAKQAVSAYCTDCIFDAHEPGNWRQQVTACATRSCDLYRVRPKTSKALTPGEVQERD